LSDAAGPLEVTKWRAPWAILKLSTVGIILRPDKPKDALEPIHVSDRNLSKKYAYKQGNAAQESYKNKRQFDNSQNVFHG